MNTPKNILPMDGEVYYFPHFFSVSESDQLYQSFLETIEWQKEVLKMFGKEIVLQRETAFYADKGIAYTYSGKKKTPLPWTTELFQIKKQIQKTLLQNFNACLLNLYHDGGEGMGWHSDDEKELKKDGTIVSVSFGAIRKFQFKHKSTGEKVEINLNHGSILVMKGKTQTYWKHQLPKTKKVKEGRINLTFRTF